MVNAYLRAFTDLVIAGALIYCAHALLSVHRGIINQSIAWGFRAIGFHFLNAGYLFLATRGLGWNCPYFACIEIGMLYAIGDYVVVVPTLVMVLILTGQLQRIAAKIKDMYDLESNG